MPIENITNLAIIVAAGRGTRAQSSDGGGNQEVPKVYRQMPHDNRVVLAAGLAEFIQHPQIQAVMVVIHKDDVELYNSVINNLNNNDKLLDYVEGGDTRQHSVFNGLQAASAHKPTHVLIHDAARPYVSADLISRCLTGLGTASAVIPTIAPRDTLKQAENGTITTLPRENIWLAQTPQAFHYAALLAAYQQIPEAILNTLTDDAAIAEMAGLPQALVAGEESNIKLTFPTDFKGASSVMLPRTGFGYDVHRLGDAGSAHHIMLCGVEVAHTQALIGHSDADVALHALTDALLGALAVGDIGVHFPPDDKANENRASHEFLAFAVGLAAQKAAQITHIDMTLVCEHPKITPYRNAMQKRISEITGLAASAISIKATTTEGLGAIGRGEGIAAYASLTLLMPSPLQKGENHNG